MTLFRSCILTFTLLASTVRAQADVFVVAAAGGGDYTDLGLAVANAADGDVLLVKSGVYTGFTLTDKALDIAADSGATVLVNGWIRVQSLAATRTFTFTGIDVHAPPGFAALILGGNAGSVRIQGCTLRGGDAATCSELSDGGDALIVGACADVAIARSTLLGGAGGESVLSSGFGGYGLLASMSRVALHGCTLIGGRGDHFTYACPPSYGYGYAGRGGDGAGVGSGLAFFASGCQLSGGDGGDSVGTTGVMNGCGGSGLGSGQTPSSALRALDVTFVSGTSGQGPQPCTAFPPVYTPGATLTVFPGTARRLTASRVTREQGTVRMEVTGTPGDRVEILFGERARFVPTDAARGVHLVARRPLEPVLQAGTIGANGTLSLAWTVNDLGLGTSARRLFAQAACTDASGKATLTGSVTLVLLDAGF